MALTVQWSEAVLGTVSARVLKQKSLGKKVGDKVCEANFSNLCFPIQI
ncbi:hypothetical protein SSU05_0617 [Streptococcus suis 05ZYH33]|nr:hypothetical protein SSU05_0617 [Streptococcus suis 05ZYH33]